MNEPDPMAPRAEATYYALIGEGFPRARPLGIVRRRLMPDGVEDEALNRDLNWDYTDYLFKHQLGLESGEHIEITRDEAQQLVAQFRQRVEAAREREQSEEEIDSEGRPEH